VKETLAMSEVAAPAVESRHLPAPLVVSHLSRSYGRWRAVREVSFELRPGGVTGLLGPNGAGKTSLLGCIAGIAPWDDGEIVVDGVDAARRPALARQKVGFMPERVAFWNEMEIESYLQFVARVKGIARAARSDAVELALFRAGLIDVRSRIIGNLSKGYRQRVGLAQALLGDPPVVILDEPMAGLDPLNAIEIREVLSEYAQERVVLLSTHVVADIRMMCSRVLMMSRGRLVYDGQALAVASASGSRRLRLRIGRVRGSEEIEFVATRAGARPIRTDLQGEGAELTVDVTGDESADRLVRALLDAGYAIFGVEGTTDTLEEAFREAVLEAHDQTGESR
jgi:ABC-2 type transport system ATP-binding protein